MNYLEAKSREILLIKLSVENTFILNISTYYFYFIFIAAFYFSPRKISLPDGRMAFTKVSYCVNCLSSKMPFIFTSLICSSSCKDFRREDLLALPNCRISSMSVKHSFQVCRTAGFCSVASDTSLLISSVILTALSSALKTGTGSARFCA